MTIMELIDLLRQYPEATRVTLEDPDTGWNLPLLVLTRPEEATGIKEPVVYLTACYSAGQEKFDQQGKN